MMLEQEACIRMKFEPDSRFYESSLILILLFGVLCGTIAANCLYRLDITFVQPFILDQYYSETAVTYYYKKLAVHIIPQRVVQVFLIGACTIIFSGPGIYYVLFYFFSLIWGFLASLEIIRLGLHGLLLSGICIIPHGFVYCLILYLSWHLDMNSNKKKYLVLLGLFVLALFLEIFLEPRILNWFGTV